MPIATILSLVLRAVPEAISAYNSIRATMSETDQATLDAQMATADEQVTVDHAELAAALSN